MDMDGCRVFGLLVRKVEGRQSGGEDSRRRKKVTSYLV
jgi:hypothetical protein